MRGLKTWPADFERLRSRQAVIRLAASFVQLSHDQCTIPDRCEARSCARCGRGVHYDPKAAIPLLGPEVIVCDRCQPEVIDQLSGTTG